MRSGCVALLLLFAAAAAHAESSSALMRIIVPFAPGGINDTAARLFRPDRPTRSVYDAFMLRLHDYLKANEDFQERGNKHYWKFPPGSALVARRRWTRSVR